jgi:hypothetical protein
MLINSDRAWQQLIRNKCLGSKSLTQVTKKIGGLPILVWLDECKDDFLSMGGFTLQNGKVVRFWKDIWLGGTDLKVQYPNLYNIVRRNAMVAEIFSSRLLNVSFQRNLVAKNLQSWYDLVLKLSSICLTDRDDYFKWSLNSNGQFSVSSMYQGFLDTNVVPTKSYL